VTVRRVGCIIGIIVWVVAVVSLAAAGVLYVVSILGFI